MPFRFPLATVLKLRESIEKREELALQKIQLEIGQTLHRIEELGEEMVRMRATREQAMVRPTPAMHVQLLELSMQSADEQRKALKGRLVELEQQRLRQVDIYQAAHRDRETLTHLHRKQRDLYEQERLRAEQKTLDDIFIARRRTNLMG
jgi:flagellar FliJ protein